MTDSTACVPAPVARAARLRVVPLDLVVDGVRSLDGELAPAELVEALARGARVSTSQPPPSAFAATYARAVVDGAREIVSVHLSGALSGTVAAARLAAAGCDVPVRVVDSGTVAMGLGFAALAAARAVAVPAPPPRWRSRRRTTDDAGPDADQVAAVATATAATTTTWFLVDSLEQLRRGGRLSAGAAVLGTLLALHPLLTVADGRLAVGAKVRTRRAARARLEQLAVDAVLARDGARLAVQHLAEPAQAAALAAAVAERVGDRLVETVVADVGPVLAAHVGPGVLAVVVATA